MLMNSSNAQRSVELGIFVDTLICPTFQLAITQIAQMPGISGLPNNTMLFEFDEENPEEIEEIVQGTHIAVNSLFQHSHP